MEAIASRLEREATRNIVAILGIYLDLTLHLTRRLPPVSLLRLLGRGVSGVTT